MSVSQSAFDAAATELMDHYGYEEQAAREAAAIALGIMPGDTPSGNDALAWGATPEADTEDEE